MIDSNKCKHVDSDVLNKMIEPNFNVDFGEREKNIERFPTIVSHDNDLSSDL